MSFSVPAARRAVLAALFAVAGLVPAPPVAAQALQGRVLVGEAPVPDVELELHRVTPEAAGVIARARSDARGAFRFEVPPVDSVGFTVFFATATYQGVRYFGTPLHPGDARDDYTIAVFDTVAVSAAEAPVRVQRRDVILMSELQGGWEVNELLRIENPGSRTLVGAGGLPTWEFPVPAEATGFEVGEGELDGTELVRMGDRVLLTTPLVPGVRELFLRYRIPASASAGLDLAVHARTGVFNLLVEHPSPPITVSGLQRGEVFEADTRVFTTYQATDLDPTRVVTVAWTPGGPPFDPTTAALAVLGILLAVGAVAGVRSGRARRSPPPPAPDDGSAVPIGAVVRDAERTKEPLA